MEKTFIGIDVGKDGAITYVTPNGNWTSYKMPLIGKEVDTNRLSEIIKNIAIGSLKEGWNVFGCIEDVHAIFGSSAKATFQFGRNAGMLEMALVANEIPFALVQPKAWQKEMWQGVPIVKRLSKSGKTKVTDTKKTSEIACKRLFPNMDLRATERCKTNDEGIIDSVLICEYARRKYR